VKELEAAARLANDDPVVLEHLGDAYLKMDDDARALKTYEAALRKHPKAENAETLREKIEQIKKRLEHVEP
jgi:regulator of sirC expression with transglutaminase-like and TPR domain